MPRVGEPEPPPTESDFCAGVTMNDYYATKAAREPPPTESDFCAGRGGDHLPDLSTSVRAIFKGASSLLDPCGVG